ncbi:hypothetical protein B0H14DRAFT_2752990 [Mycena olivaceomarginata]|nr:hypothetical protein B0H14DRAFT_2752990 [Mycena olivaceomarginata]
MNNRSSSARQKRWALRGLRPAVPPKIRSGSASRGTMSPSDNNVLTSVYPITGSDALPALSSSAECHPRATTNIAWMNDEIITFLSGVRSKDGIGRISVKLKKTTAQVQDCYNVLARAGLLHGRLDAPHVESSSKALHHSYKVTIKSQPRTSEERKIWDWRRKLRRAFFRRSASHFEPKPLQEEEVDKMHKLFLHMNSALVNPLYIKSTSIIKELNQIKKRDDKFGRKAKTLRNKWANIINN